MSTRISWKKRPQLQKEFNDNDAYLTADNINEIVDGINNNYEDLTLASSELLSKINTNNTALIDKNTNLSRDIQQLSTSIDNLKNINEDFNELSDNFNELSNNLNNLNSVTSSYYAVDAISADYAISAQNAQHTKIADVALTANYVLKSEVDRIINLAKGEISPGNGGTPATSLKSLVINNGAERVIYNGSSVVEINSIYNAVSAEYSINAINSNNADIALSANMLTNKLIFKNTDNVITEFNGNTTVSLVDGINYATSSKYTLSANYAIDANEAVSASVLKNKIIFKNNNNQICQFNGKTELDLSNGINYATNANEANIALTANKLSNNLTIVDADGTEYIYNGTTPIIINSISHAKTADSLTDTSQFNFSISNITFPLTNDLSITYDGSEPLDLTDNLFAKQASVANSLKNSITFKTWSNSSNTFNGTNDLTIDSILSAKYSEYTAYATCDGNGNIISDTYQPIIKDVKYSYIVIIHGNEQRRLTNSTTNNTGALSQHRKVQTFDFDKTYSLIVNDNKIYPGGNTTISDPYTNGFDCNKALNSEFVSDLNNISYTFILNKCCAAIANNKLYVWGRSDNYWYGLCDSNNLNSAISNNLSTPTYVQHFYKIATDKKSIYNKCSIQSITDADQTSTIDTTKIINNNLQQLIWEDLVDVLEEIEVGVVKIVKGGFGCGALAIAENGKLYGCGKNKNQIFGRQFKNNCILKAWVELPVNDIIDEKIVDIQSAHTDKTDVFMIRTMSGRIYITGYVPTTVSAIKLPIFVSDNNIYKFSSVSKIENLTPSYSISQNTIHCDPWYTGEIESINGWLNGWYCWTIASDTFSGFKLAAISPSGIVAINNNNLLYEGYDIFKSDQTSAKYIFQNIQYADDGQDQYLKITDFVASNEYDIQLTKDSIFLKYKNIIYGASLASPQLRNSATSLLVDTNTLHVQQIDEYENIQALKVNKCDDETILLILTNQSASQNLFDIRETLLNTGQAAIECLDINAAVIGLSASIDNSNKWTKFWDPNDNNYDVQYALYYTAADALLKEQLVTVYNGMDTYAFDLTSNNIYFTDMEYSDAGLTEIVLNTFDNSIISSKIYVLFSYIKPNTSAPAATPSSYVYEIPTSQQQTKSQIQLNLVDQVAGITAISAMYQNSKTKNYEFFIFDGLSRENDALYNPSSVTFDYAAFKQYFTE